MYFPLSWFSDLIAWCLRVPAIGLVVVSVAIGVMLWSPWEEIAPGSVPVALPPACVPESMATFSFEGGYESTYTRGFPILERYHFKATVYVITGAIGTPGYLTLEQLHELGRNGWWVGSATITHPYLPNLSPQELRQELRGSKEMLHRWGFEAVDFVSPFGAFDEAILEQIKAVYATHLTLEPGLNRRPIDRYRLRALVLRPDTSPEEVFSWILRAKEEKGWLILTLQQIDEAGEESYRSEDLERIALFLKEQGFEGICPFSNLEVTE